MFYVRQGATHKICIGPAVAVANGYVPVTNLSLSGADEAEVILHDNGTVVDISGYTFAAITTADGYYHLTLQSGISNTVGHVTVVVNDDSLILPIRTDFTVVEEAVYDALFAASALGYVANAPVNVAQFGGSNGTFSSGRPEVNATHAAGTAWASGSIPRAAFAADTGLQSIRSNTATAGAAGSITLDASASSVTDFYKGAGIYTTGGTGVGQLRICSAYNGTSKAATISPNWATNPDNTTTFAVIPAGGVLTAGDIATAVGTELSDDFTGVNSKLDTIDDFLDLEVAAIKTKTDFLPSATAGASGGLLISGSNSGTTTLGALTVTGATTLTGALTATNASNAARLGTFTVDTNAIAWPAAWDTEVQSECTDALNAYDGPTKAELDTAVANLVKEDVEYDVTTTNGALGTTFVTP